MSEKIQSYDLLVNFPDEKNEKSYTYLKASEEGSLCTGTCVCKEFYEIEEIVEKNNTSMNFIFINLNESRYKLCKEYVMSELMLPAEGKEYSII